MDDVFFTVYWLVAIGILAYLAWRAIGKDK